MYRQICVIGHRLTHKGPNQLDIDPNLVGMQNSSHPRTQPHGATAGKLDDNMLFYLLSRGLDRDTALRLLKWAFLEDVVSKAYRRLALR